MSRFLVVEGTECAGKTTLISEVRRRIPLDVKYLGHRPGCDQFQRYLVEYASASQCILNRSHISETIYASINDRPPSFSELQSELLDGILLTTAVLVHCFAPTSVLVERLTTRSNLQPVIPDSLEELNSAFLSHVDRLEAHADAPTIIRYSSTGDHLPRVLAQIEELLLFPATDVPPWRQQ